MLVQSFSLLGGDGLKHVKTPTVEPDTKALNHCSFARSS